MNKTAIIRCEHFNASTDCIILIGVMKKIERFSANVTIPNYHGHNYDLEVKVIGFCDPESGYVIDAKILSDLIKDKILDRFDHKNLNLDTSEFKTLNPTAENIAMVIYNLLRPELDESLELKIKLFETARNYVEYPYK